MDKIQQYRQPMVTATGIFLGFMLDYVNGWMPNAFTVHKFRDTVIGLGIVCSIALLVIVLWRILSIAYKPESAEAFYKKTLRLFITGIVIPFVSMVIVMARKLIDSVF